MHTCLNPLKKLLIIVSLIIASTTINLYSEEINIKINGEEYSREMPEDLESAKILIRSMSEMINNADNTIINLQNKTNYQTSDTSEKISSLETKLNTVEKELENANKKLENSEKGINSLIKTNTRNTPFLVIGPTIGIDRAIGFHFMIGTEYRIFRNFHIGGSIFSTIYSNSDNRIFDIGAGLILGYSIK